MPPYHYLYRNQSKMITLGRSSNPANIHYEEIREQIHSESARI